MCQPTHSPVTMMHILGNYQANSQFHSVQNQPFFTGSPSNMQDFLHLNRNASNQARRQSQQIPYIPEFLNFHLDPQTINFGALNGRNSNWSQHMKSPNNLITSQRPHTVTTPVNVQGNQKQSFETVKKQNWNNKINKRRQDWGAAPESCNSSDSSISSRSSTPNKHYNGSQAESSDDRESLSSISEFKFKNKNMKQNKKRGGNLYSSLSTGNLYQEQNQPIKFNETTSQTEVQSNQNRRKPIVKNSPKSHRNYKGHKFSSNTHDLPGNFKHRNFHNPADRFMHQFHLEHAVERPKDLLVGSVYDRLSAAVWEKFEQNQLSFSNFCHKMYLWKYLSFCITTRFPYYAIHMVGSTLNGFGSNASDVDMCLLVNDNMMDNRYEAIIRLEQIMSYLRKSEFIKHLELIHAKVPILKIRDNVYDLHVDLNYNNSVGIRNTHLLYCYSKIDWRVKPLASVVKLWAQVQNINDPRNMTISSYSLILMVIHFLQCGVTPAVLPCLHNIYKEKFHPMSNVFDIEIHEDLKIPPYALTPRNSQTLGELLVEFFSYYNSFDYARYAISVRVAGKIPIERCRKVISSKNDFHQWKYLCIEEPFEFTNTARSVYDPSAFEMIKKIIHKTYAALKETNELQSIFTKMEID